MDTFRNWLGHDLQNLPPPREILAAFASKAIHSPYLLCLAWRQIIR